jgi:hypothetical protein
MNTAIDYYDFYDRITDRRKITGQTLGRFSTGVYTINKPRPTDTTKLIIEN